MGLEFLKNAYPRCRPTQYENKVKLCFLVGQAAGSCVVACILSRIPLDCGKSFPRVQHLRRNHYNRPVFAGYCLHQEQTTQPSSSLRNLDCSVLVLRVMFSCDYWYFLFVLLHYSVLLAISTMNFGFVVVDEKQLGAWVLTLTMIQTCWSSQSLA